jgi:hypothetical protein
MPSNTLRIILLLLSATSRIGAAQPPTEVDFPSGKVQLVPKVVSQEYCESESGEPPKLKFVLSAQFKNVSDTPIVFNRIGIGDGVYVGKSIGDMKAGKYEGGSRVPDAIGISSSTSWAEDRRVLAAGTSLEITTRNIWIRLSMHRRRSQLGASPGVHYLQIFAEVEVSDESHSPRTLLLSSVPTRFVVDRHAKFGTCR